MTKISAWAAAAPGEQLTPVTLDRGPLGSDEIEIAVDYCGVCHSDLSMLKNDWGMTTYPLVPGHEAIGRVTAMGSNARGLSVGQRVGIGWTASSCMYCKPCKSGDNHLCATAQPTIVGHAGGFAQTLRSHWTWAIPVPDALDPSAAGPLLCGGITVFSPLASFNLSPTAHVGIVGIGGLGHMALKFANAWGCEVTAFTSNLSKAEEARSFGAHHVIATHDTDTINKHAGIFDLILVTSNVPLDWAALVNALAPKGRLHVVGVVLEPMAIDAISLIMGEKSVSGSPTGSPQTLATMLEFAARHKILPQVERYKMSEVNSVMARLVAGKVRYRAVLEADFG